MLAAPPCWTGNHQAAHAIARHTLQTDRALLSITRELTGLYYVKGMLTEGDVRLDASYPAYGAARSGRRPDV